MSEIPRAINFLTKPAYEPGDVPRFDKARFVAMVARDHINGFGGTGTRPGPRGAVLPATWQDGNKAEPSAKVTRSAKSYEGLLCAARPTDVDGKPRPVWDPKYNYDPNDSPELKAKKCSFRVDAARGPYSDIRQHGKARCKPDVTYAEAARREHEAFLHGAIDRVAATRRRQIKRQRETRLWVSDRKQPKRILYLLKQPRTWLEARILLYCVQWFLSDHPFALPARLSTDKSVNCVSDKAMDESRDNDRFDWFLFPRSFPEWLIQFKKQTYTHQRRVFPTANEELDLIRTAKAGDPIARQRLLDVHWPCVCSIARGHVTAAFPLDDLIGEGCFGLIEALDKFDPEKGYRLSTFARLPIEWRILNYKRREQKEDIPLDGELLELVSGNLADLGNFNDSSGGAARTSQVIRDTADRMTAHISPFENGLAPETRDFIAELNAEAAKTAPDSNTPDWRTGLRRGAT